MYKHSNSREDVADMHRHKMEEGEDETGLKKQSGQSSSAKLSVSSADDPSENYANAIAKKVADGQQVEVCPPNNSIEQIQPKKDGKNVSTDSGFESQLNSSKSSGKPLDDSIRSEMESKMKSDFSNVNIHTDSTAHSMNDRMNSKAFAHERDVYFKNGNYNPDSTQGKELLAHELVHTQHGSSNQIFRQTDDLNKLKTYDQSEFGKAKNESQDAIDEAIKKQPRDKDDLRTQGTRNEADELIKKIEKKISEVRADYIKELRKAGVKEDDDYPDAAIPGSTLSARAEAKNKLIELYNEYDIYAGQYTGTNNLLRQKRMDMLDTKQKEDVQTYSLSLYGIKPDLEQSLLPPDKRADELLDNAEIDARTSYKKYRQVLEEKKNAPYVKEKNDIEQKIEWIESNLEAEAILHPNRKPDSNIRSLLKKYKSELKNTEEKHEATITPFDRSKKLMEEYIEGKAEKGKDIGTEELKLILKYFLKGNPNEEDKFLLLRFLRQYMNEDNLDAVVGGEDEKGKIKTAELLEIFEDYDLEEDEERMEYFTDPQRKKKFKEKRRETNKPESRHKRRDIAKGEAKQRRKNINAGTDSFFTKVWEHIKVPFQKATKKKELREKETGERPVNEYAGLVSYKEQLENRLKSKHKATESNLINKEQNTLTNSTELDTDVKGNLNSGGFKGAGNTVTNAWQNNQTEVNMWTLASPMDSFYSSSGESNYEAATILSEALKEYTDKVGTQTTTADLEDLKDKAWKYYQKTPNANLSETAFKNLYTSPGAIEKLLNGTVNPSALQDGKFISGPQSLEKFGEFGLDIGKDFLKDQFMAGSKTKYALDPLLKNPWVKAGGLIAGAGFAAYDTFKHPKAGLGQSVPLFMNFVPALEKKLWKEKKILEDNIVSNKLLTGFLNTKSDKGPALSQFNILYNDKNQNKDDKPASFLTLGLKYLSNKTQGDVTTQKAMFETKITFNYIPGTFETTSNEQSFSEKAYMIMTKPSFLLHQGEMAEILGQATGDTPYDKTKGGFQPTYDKLNSWLTVTGSYETKKLLLGGTVKGGLYDMFGANKNKMMGLDVDLQAKLKNLRLSNNLRLDAGAYFKGSYSNNPTGTPSPFLNTTEFGGNASLKFKSFVMDFGAMHSIGNQQKTLLNFDAHMDLDLKKFGKLQVGPQVFDAIQNGQHELYIVPVNLKLFFGRGGQGVKKKFGL